MYINIRARFLAILIFTAVTGCGGGSDTNSGPAAAPGTPDNQICASTTEVRSDPRSFTAGALIFTVLSTSTGFVQYSFSDGTFSNSLYMGRGVCNLTFPSVYVLELNNAKKYYQCDNDVLGVISNCRETSPTN